MQFEFMLPRNTKQKALNLVINSNDRFHFQQKAKMTRRLRELAKYEASTQIKAGFRQFDELNPCKVLVTAYSPTNRRLDPPNLYPTVKALIDGLTDAKIWSDDNYKVIKQMSFAYGGLSGERGHYRIRIEVTGNEK